MLELNLICENVREKSIYRKYIQVPRTQKKYISEVYSDPSQKSDMKLFSKIVYGFKLFMLFKNSFPLDV